MSLGAAIAQSLWALGNLGAARRFASALTAPEIVQAEWLRRRLHADAKTVFGREHHFAEIRSYADFVRHVPLRAWDEFQPWVERIRRGEHAVLTAERVTHLAPTSGSNGARKLIPFTAGLQRGFSTAVGTWMTDLVRTRPSLLTGSAYWSVSPLEAETGDRASAVPIGFADDADYLGAGRAWLVRQVLAVPAALRHERDIETFWFKTLLALLCRSDLRLISIWHPSFLDLLLEAAARQWPELCEAVETRRGRARAAELRRAGPQGSARWWPGLCVTSCWGEQAAESGFKKITKRFPGVWVQAKGLLATEAVVTLPWCGVMPLAVTSHFFEFIDSGGEVRRAHELERGKSYEVVVTNGGGLWRYRLGDVVECTGWLAATPTLRFLGRAGNVSDLRGEKLSEVFVAEVLRRLWPEGDRVCWLQAEHEPARYTLWIEGDVACEWAEKLETALAENPHYALARRLGQLAHVGMKCVPVGSAGDFLKMSRGRLGDLKPPTLIGVSEQMTK